MRKLISCADYTRKCTNLVCEQTFKKPKPPQNKSAQPRKFKMTLFEKVFDLNVLVVLNLLDPAGINGEFEMDVGAPKAFLVQIPIGSGRKLSKIL